MSDLNLSINIGAIDSASAVLRSVGKVISDVASGNIAGAAVVAATAVVGITAASVKMAADFQSSLTSLSTGAGEAQSNLKMVGDGILNLAVQTGTSTKQLTDGMYMIESAGYHGAQGLQVLQTAAEGAKVGNADLGVTANALTTILTDYHMSADQSSQAMNGLTATVASGKTHLQDLASSMSAVLPLASSLGIRFPEVAGALATMTNAGMSAQHASQNLANAIRSLSAPGATATKSMKDVGLSAQELKDATSKDLPTALQLIEDHIGKKFPAGSIQATTALKNIMGGATGLNVALMLGGKNLQGFQGNINGIAQAMNTGGNSVTGWNQVQDTFNFKMSQAQQAVNVLMIKLGTALLPILSQLVGAVAPAINGFITWESKTHTLENAFHLIVSVIGNVASAIGNVISFFQKNQIAMNALLAVLAGVGGVILIFAAMAIPALVAGFIAWAIAAGTAAIATLAAAWPFILIGAIIAAVVFGIIEAVQHWGQIVAWLQGVWGAISSWFMGMLHTLGAFFVGVWNGIVSGLKAAWNAIVNVVKIGAMLLIAAAFAPIIIIAGLFIWLYKHNTYFKAMIDAIVGFVKFGIGWLQHAWQEAVAWIVAEWNLLVKFATDLWELVSKTISDKFNAAIGFVQSIWQKISSFFVNAWNTYIAGPLHTLWTNVSGVFTSAWNTYIAKPLTDIWNNVSKWFTDLGTNAMNSGKNFISMLVSGITSGAGAIWNAVTGIAKNIWKALGFHSPAEAGPGADADRWMPNLVNMLSAGLVAGVPKIQAAVSLVAKPLAVIGQPASHGATSPVAAPTSSSGGTVVYYLTVNAPALSKREAQTLGDTMIDYMSRKQRSSGNNVTWTSGGKT